MTLASPLKRHLFDSLVVLLAVIAEIKVWIAPGSGPKAVFIVCSLLWTLPLLLRRRLPFAAPVLCFAVQAGSAFADPTLGAETTALLAFLLAFWVVGAYNERTQAIAGTAIGFACMGVVVRVDERLGLEEAVSGILFGGTVSVIAYALQQRRKRAAELEERAAGLEREGAQTESAAVAARAAPDRSRAARRDRAFSYPHDCPGGGGAPPSRRGPEACAGARAVGRGHGSARTGRAASSARDSPRGRG